MNFYVMLVCYAWILACCVLCFRNVRRIRKTAQRIDESKKKLDVYMATKSSVLIEALENLAAMTCPFCAVAALKGKMKNQSGDTVEAESEIEGMHSVTINNVSNQLPCVAAKTRADARDLFAETMKEAVVHHGKSAA